MLSRIGDWQRRGKFWHNLITGRIIPVIAGGALPASDAFTTASDQGLTTYSASWTYNGTAVFTVYGATDDIASTYSGGGDQLAHWNADTFNNNQYAQAKFSARNGNDAGPAVRVAASAVTAYVFSSSSANSYLAKYVSGTYTQLGSNATAAALNDTLKITASGTTITPNINGSTSGTPGAQTDSAIASGSGGVYGYSNSSQSRLDDWEAGDVGGAATGQPTMARWKGTPGMKYSGRNSGW